MGSMITVHGSVAFIGSIRGERMWGVSGVRIIHGEDPYARVRSRCHSQEVAGNVSK